MFTLNVDGEAAFDRTKAAAPAPLQILIVEDDEADAYLIKRLLSENPRIGRVIRAVDGVEALELLAVGVSPDLAFIDLQMPRMNGFALVGEIGARRLRFPTIVLTSTNSPSDLTRNKLRCANRILSKPDTVSKMRAVLNQAIEIIDV